MLNLELTVSEIVTFSWLNVHLLMAEAVFIFLLKEVIKMGKYESLAKDIIKNVGGKENVVSLAHCVTRLRFQLKDESKANTEVLKNMDGVVTVMISNGQYQIVIGNHVPDVYKDVCAIAGISANTKEEAKKMSFGAKVLDLITGIFMPSVGILCASGILKGINTLLGMAGLIATTSGLGQILAAAADALTLFFPVILGYSAFKKLGGSPFLGMTLGAALCYPAIQGVDLEVFGMTVNATYQSTVLPVILLSFVAVPFEKFLNRVVPDVVKTFVTPALVLGICLPLGFCIIGPVANLIAALIVSAFNSLYQVAPVVAAAVLAGLWQVLVIFGVHGMLVMTFIVGLVQGVDQPLMAALCVCSFVQTGAVMGIWLKTKNQKLKNIALPAWISGIFGVTEPAIYGVTLPAGKQFAYTCVISAVLGGVGTLLGINTYSMAGMGVFSIPGAINPANPGASLLTVCLLYVIAVVAGLAVAYITYKDDALPEMESPQKENVKVKKEVISSPITGKVLPLTEVEDEAFSGELLGKGIAIVPQNGEIVAPCSGTVITLFPTKHAIGIVSDNGAEVLIHLGLNTVQLEGKHFTAHIQAGDKVVKGQLLVSCDLEEIEKAGYSMVSPVIITNTSDYLDIVPMVKDSVNKEEELLTLIN